MNTSVNFAADDWVAIAPVMKTADPRKTTSSFVGELATSNDLATQSSPMDCDYNAAQPSTIPSLPTKSNDKLFHLAKTLKLHGRLKSSKSFHSSPIPPTPSPSNSPTPIPPALLSVRKHTKPHKKNVTRPKLNGYRVYPALCQVMEAREFNHRAHIKSIQVGYNDKRESDMDDLMRILSLLHNSLDSCKAKTSAMNEATAALTSLSKILDKQCEKMKIVEEDTNKKHREMSDLYAHTMANECSSQTAKISCMFTLTADVVSLEEESSNPFHTFQLHRRFAPYLLGLM